MHVTRITKGIKQLQTRQAFFRAAPESARDWSINSIRTNHLIKLTVLVGDVELKALLDLGAQGNYISRTAVERAGLKPQYKTNLYPLQVANRELMLGEDKVMLKV